MEHATATNSVRVAILPSDPLDEIALLRLIGEQPTMSVHPLCHARTAHVLIVTASLVTKGMLQQMNRLGAGPSLPVAMILERLGEADLLASIDCGLRGVLWRRQLTSERFCALVQTARDSCDEPAHEVHRRLMRDAIPQQRTAQTVGDPSLTGLKPREIEVLALIADGVDNIEIARRMQYSERTVKYIISGILDRFGLRNRSHAVAYALRTGIIR